MTEIIIWALAVAGSGLVLTQSTLAAPIRDGLAAWAERVSKIRVLRLAAKLVSCPMCAGFWLGAGWAALLGERAPAWIAAFGFAGSITSALGVALWLALGEITAALGLWRYLNTPKDNR